MTISRLDIQQMIIDAANRLGVPTNIALGIASHESGFDPTVTHKNTNGTIDYSVMQLNTSTVKTLGVADPMDPQQNIDAGVGLIATLLKTYNGDVAKALWAYADGAGSVAKNRMSDVAQQFIGYVTGYGGGTAVDPTKRVPPPQLIKTMVAAKPKPTPGSGPPSGSGSSHLAGWFLATISLLCLARVQAQAIRQDTLTLTAPAPPAVTQVSTNVTGPRGGVRYSYWVIANYPGGSAQPAGTIETNAPTALSGSNFVTIQWSVITGATSYDVLRTNTETFPSGPCTCAVATAVVGSSTTDTGSALTLYAWTPKLPATGTIRIDNSGATPAFVTNPSLGGGVAYIYVRSTTGTTAYAGAGVPTLAAYVTGVCVLLNADTSNTTTATINVDGLGAKSILGPGGGALAANDITANQPKLMCYNGTQFIIQGGSASGATSLSGLTDLQCTVASTVATCAAGAVDFNPANVPTPILLGPGTITKIAGTDTGAIRVYGDYNSGAPVLACAYTGITIANYTVSIGFAGSTCIPGSSFPSGSYPIARIDVNAGVLQTPLDQRSLFTPPEHVEAGSGLGRIGNVMSCTACGGSPFSSWHQQAAPVVLDSTDKTIDTATVTAGAIAAGQCLGFNYIFKHSAGTAAVTTKLFIGATSILIQAGNTDVTVWSAFGTWCNDPASTTSQQVNFNPLNFNNMLSFTTLTGCLICTTAENTASPVVIKLTANGANTEQMLVYAAHLWLMP